MTRPKDHYEDTLHDVTGDRIPFIDGGKTEHVPARYTFVYENRDGERLIAHHRSSIIP